MEVLWIGALLAALALGGFLAGRFRALKAAGGDTRVLHSVPNYSGTLVALSAALPAFALSILLAAFGVAPAVLWGATILAGVIGFALSLRLIGRDFRARNAVEAVIKGLLIAAASLAILTTLGIVLSLVFNTIEFFRLYPLTKFFFGTEWTPSFGGGSELGILPLLWGTLYISFVALAVAVPIGLFAAIYLSEYASRTVRGAVKPLLEVLAGIPTIVYGLFALLTVGPFLLSIFGPKGPTAAFADGGWMHAGTAVMTAGLVMGIMLIPFVSSLSDDIINAVPQALRDGSYGLGATKSETIRQVVMPAALPGIVGAILLAASRAIGETMIVVLGAGAAARLSLNPFDAMTTVTAKIVSQLTGDADFASPEALVAFSLGMTLFVVTLGLNIFALYIVRKYREQYE
ncbi:phosphate ABC transporter permease subunit PstC [Thioclava atlantica]|uniref:Phosphate transport system permease protein n=1 Tax=Thioclava atlantica TaxID=1317124 RepID=A0A085TWT8_9RHOB|nr:phosphate ABC transporter permease subunit PstC [Thioclava atlantica]KFE35185.1 phosphate ABC transporter, inner membrane subunit PstC [Thioclava atlantica]